MTDAFVEGGLPPLILKGAPDVVPPPPPPQSFMPVGQRYEYDFLAIHLSKTALYDFVAKLEVDAKKGICGLTKSLVRHVPIHARTLEEYTMVFSSVPTELRPGPHKGRSKRDGEDEMTSNTVSSKSSPVMTLVCPRLRVVKSVKKPKQVSSYLGLRPVLKWHVLYIFKNFRAWVDFVGIAACCAVRHDPDTAKWVLVIPFAPLRPATNFDSSQPSWVFLEQSGRRPLLLTTSIPLDVRHPAKVLSRGSEWGALPSSRRFC
jgi:hypothetical protein